MYQERLTLSFLLLSELLIVSSLLVNFYETTFFVS